MSFVVLVAGPACDDANLVRCGFGATAQKIDGEQYCVYTPEQLDRAGDGFRCPSELPYELDVGEFRICTADATETPMTLPEAICATVQGGCAGREVDAGSVGRDAGRPEAGAGGGCVAGASAEIVDVRAEAGASAVQITTDTRWTCDRVWVVHSPVEVLEGATLHIEPGTEIRVTGRFTDLRTTSPDADPEPAPGTIRAQGTQQSPIVLTAAGAPGTRRSWSWGSLEGCLELAYVRVEFARAVELQCDRPNHVVHHLQVHRVAAGLTVSMGYSLRHIVISGVPPRTGGYGGYGFQFTDTWEGDAGYVVVSGQGRGLVSRSFVGSDGFEGSIFNLTLIGLPRATGSPNPAVPADAVVHNAIIVGWESMFDDFFSERPLVTHSIIHSFGGDGGESFFVGVDAARLETHFRHEASANRFGVDPSLPDGAWSDTAPSWVPPAGSPAATGGTAPPDDGTSDPDARYVGAFEPGGEDWSAGWTAYPPN